MCDLAKFSTTTTAWLLEEQKNDLMQLGNSALVRALLGLTGVDNILSYKESSFNLLDASKKIVMEEMSSDTGLEQAVACTFQRQRELAREVDALISEAMGLVAKLEEACRAAPTFDPDKAAIANTIDGLKKVYSMAQVDPMTPAGEVLQELVSSGLISQGSLDRYLQSANIGPSAPRNSSSQIVNELRDRYYTIDRGSPAPQSTTAYGETPKDGFRIVNEDGEIVNSITGMDRGELMPDGTIIVWGPANSVAQVETQVLKIEPEYTTARPSRRFPTLAMKEADSQVEVEESLAYEVWACLMLDIVGKLAEVWGGAKIAVGGMIDTLATMNAMASMKPPQLGIGKVSVRAMGSIYKIDALLNEIIGSANLSAGVVGIQDSLSLRGSLGTQVGSYSGGLVCDYNHERYCEIHRSLLEFSENFRPELDLLNFSFGGVDIGDLSFDIPVMGGANTKFPEVVLALSEIIRPLQGAISVGDEMLMKIKGDICAFIAKRMKGVPKSLSPFVGFAANMAIDIGKIEPIAINLNISERLTRVADTLRRAGYEAGASLLMSGNFLDFVLLDEGKMTASGQVSACLEEMAERNPNPVARARMLELSRAASVRAEQKIVGQKIREGVRRRVSAATSYLSSQMVVEESLALAQELSSGGS